MAARPAHCSPGGPPPMPSDSDLGHLHTFDPIRVRPQSHKGSIPGKRPKGHGLGQTEGERRGKHGQRQETGGDAQNALQVGAVFELEIGHTDEGRHPHHTPQRQQVNLGSHGHAKKHPEQKIPDAGFSNPGGSFPGESRTGEGRAHRQRLPRDTHSGIHGQHREHHREIIDGHEMRLLDLQHGQGAEGSRQQAGFTAVDKCTNQVEENQRNHISQSR